MRFNPSVFSGKEKDAETGYGYFGARYMDHELMSMWLSIDPMADKYPSISPYAYCAWNPVKLVDPDGMDWDPDSKERIARFKKETENKRDAAVGDLKDKYQQVLDELDDLGKSNQMYHLEIGGTGNGNRPGGTNYDLENNWVTLTFDGTDKSLAHELKHAFQFEKGELSFSSKTGGLADIVTDNNGNYKNNVFLYDLTDEVAAHQRGELYGAEHATPEHLASIYKFKLVGTGDYYYPFLGKALYGPSNIYDGRDKARSLPKNFNPDASCLRGNIFRINNHTYIK